MLRSQLSTYDLCKISSHETDFSCDCRNYVSIYWNLIARLSTLLPSLRSLHRTAMCEFVCVCGLHKHSETWSAWVRVCFCLHMCVCVYVCIHLYSLHMSAKVFILVDNCLCVFFNQNMCVCFLLMGNQICLNVTVCAAIWCLMQGCRDKMDNWKSIRENGQHGQIIEKQSQIIGENVSLDQQIYTVAINSDKTFKYLNGDSFIFALPISQNK